jgi:hypothetical protein
MIIIRTPWPQTYLRGHDGVLYSSVWLSGQFSSEIAALTDSCENNNVEAWDPCHRGVHG